MADQNLQIKAIIEVLLKGVDLPDDLRAKLEKLGNEAGKTGEKLSLMQRVSKGIKGFFSDLTGSIIGLFGAMKLLNVAWTAFTEFARTERQWAGIVTQIKALGDATGDAAKQARDGINALADQTGFIDDDLIPAFGRLLRATKDVQAAQELLRLAAVQAANGVGDLQSNADALANALLTGTTRGLKEFGVKTGDAGKGGETLAQAIEHITRATDAMNPKLDDAQAKVDTLKQKWDVFADTAASKINHVIDLLIEYDKFVRNAPVLGALGGRTPDAAKETEGDAASKAIAKSMEGVERQAALRETVRKRQEEVDKEANDKAAAAEEELNDKLRKLSVEHFDDMRDAAQKEEEAEKTEQARLAAIRAEGAPKGSSRELTARIDAINAAYDAEVTRAKKNKDLIATINLERQAEIANVTDEFNKATAAKELDDKEKLIQAEISLEEQAVETDAGNKVEHLDRLAQLQKDLLDVQKAQELAGTEDLEAQKLAIKELYEKLGAEAAIAINKKKLDAIAEQEIESARLDVEATQTNSKANYDARKALLEKEYLKRRSEAQKNSKDLNNIDKAYTNAKRDLAIQETANQISLYATAAGQINSMLVKAFGEHKAFAIAQAIIDTAGAVAAALNSGIPYPGNVIVAGIVAALGAVQVAKIASTNIGSSGSVTAPSAGAGGGGGGGGAAGPTRRPHRSGQNASENRELGLTTGDNRFAGSTTAAALGSEDRGGGGRERRQIIINNNNDNRQTTYAPHNEVRLEGVVHGTRTQMLKDLHRGLERVERTHIRRGRVSG